MLLQNTFLTKMVVYHPVKSGNLDDSQCHAMRFARIVEQEMGFGARDREKEKKVWNTSFHYILLDWDLT